MILGPDGRPAVQLERRAIGFTDRTLPLESAEPVSVPVTIASRGGEWRGAGGRRFRREPFMREPRS